MADKKLATLKTQRAVLIDQQERTKEFLEKESHNASLAVLELRLRHIEKQMNEFSDVQSQIEKLDDNELKNSTRASYEEIYFSQQPAVTVLIQKLKQSELSTPSERSSPSPQKTVRLPKIALPSFNGNLTEWTSYFETFKVLIHEEPSLNNLQRFQYLKSTLSGPAAAQIDSLELSSDNYAVALDLLKTKYSDKKLICQTHLDCLLNIKPINISKPEQIRQFVDNTKVQLRALESLGRPVKQWDDVIVHLILSKLDASLRAAWEDKAPDLRLPTLEEILSFLSKKAEQIDVSRRAQGNSTHASYVNKSQKPIKTSLVTSKHRNCLLCKRNGHAIYKCKTFLNMSSSDRFNKIRTLHLCVNCLGEHNEVDCKSSYTCQVCKRRHHTLLHNDSKPMVNETHYSLQPSTSQAFNQTSLHSSQSYKKNYAQVLMPTVIVNVADVHGQLFPCRAIMDSGSQLNFVSERLVQRLRLRKWKASTVISGVGDIGSLTSNYQTQLQIFSRFNDFSTPLDATILSNITAPQPSTFINTNSWNIPANVQLSDPDFNQPHRIDLLIGAELHFQLLQVGQIALGENLPVLQKTLLGWVVAGKLLTNLAPRYSCNLASTAPQENESLTRILKRFWELENHTGTTPKMSNEEQLCEDNYSQHYKRNSEGRFVVKIPFRQDPNCLGDSLDLATKRFLNLERRIHKNKDLFDHYRDFIDEYIQLKHMRPLEEKELSTIKYIMPHHCIVKPDSSSTKLRVVFDASAKSTSGYSLNDVMMVGPVVQQDLFSIITRFRKHAIAITADICKMYRQVLVDPDDCVYQNILWRDHPNKKLQFYRLLTVTYGTAAAPFLATRSLVQLSLDKKDTHALGAGVINSDFYVDDMITGADCLDEARRIEREVKEILLSGGFTLKKWCSNSNELLSEIPTEDREKLLQFHETDVVKTLGLIWQPQEDQFIFKINLENKDEQKVTKRRVLADIGKLFDPMGFMNPVIVLGKIFLQQLWKLKLDWDESLPTEFHTSWLKYRSQLQLLASFQVPRRLHPFSQITDVQIHAFSDASEKAYGSCLYLRCVNKYGTVSVNLICAKSRVAPLQQTTLPRLELCAAQLMAQLVARVTPILNIVVNDVFYWTDSKIVLSWLAEASSTWCTFVANRVSNIQELTSIDNWRHVESSSNPADLVSRGALPQEFLKSTIWLHGPKFLYEHTAPWTNCKFRPSIAKAAFLERRTPKLAFTATKAEDIVQDSKYLNSFVKLQNVFSYILRFTRNAKLPSPLRGLGPLTAEERDNALKVIIKIVQKIGFSEDHLSLTKHGHVNNNSRLKCLCPFLDADGIIRVGGRLDNAELTYDSKHQMVLPPSHPFTRSIMTHLHYKHMHVGPQTLLAITRQRFWPLRGGNIARQIVHSCIRCFRTKPTSMYQLMGTLPTERVQPARPFINSGVDFCGPVYTHFKQRGKQAVKTYIAIFVCLATKAVHLELASDLSSDAFIAALKRFIGRRGLCANLYCDNATNFVGGNSQLKELRDIFTSEETRKDIVELCSKDYIDFHFIPPRSPHFGGLWEAAVKSAKYHLRRVVKGHSLTFEELYTLVIQIEAILNSRPIQAMSPDPNDLSALTPGHFLIGEPLTAPVLPALKEIRLNLLDRWQRIQLAYQQFWNRWSRTYLNQLQCRNKWNKSSPNVSTDTLVLIKEENIPPTKWILGRVVELFPGDDGKVRVVSIKTANGLFKRSVTKICPLPVNANSEHEQ